ncbi:MAG: cyclase family protein [Conexivisphaerales archaeon]
MTSTWYDFSHSYEDNMPEAIGHSPLKLNKMINKMTGSRITDLTINSHSGTHLDAPYHYIENGKTIDQFPVEFFVGLALVLNIPKGEFEQITTSDLNDSKELIKQSDFLFIRTGWEEKWGSPEYIWKYPFLAPEVADFILETKIRILGTDTISPDPSTRSGLRRGSPIHLALLSRNVLILENLTNLREVTGKVIQVYCFPLALKGIDGSPARVIGRDL